jgi:predicted GNAT family N-acyltransferase
VERNRDVRERLYPGSIDDKSARRVAARVGRQIKRLHQRQLVARIPRSRRWRVTGLGQRLMSASIRLHEQGFPDAVHARAA